MQVSKTTISTVAILVGILAIGAWFVYQTNQKNQERELQESPAAQALQADPASAPFSDFDGNKADLDQYLGEVLVVTSWASWSPFSGAELQLLSQTAESYADQGVVVLAINRGEPQSTAERYLRTIGVEGRVRLIVDPDDRYYKAIGGYTMPETLFYDRKGNIVSHKRGTLTQDSVQESIERALKQSAD